jgi:DNA-binding transcriptional LysR family regulator
LNFRSVLARVGPELAVTTLPIKELTRPHPVGLLYRKEAYQSPAMRRFIEIVRTVTKDMPR